MMMKGIDISNHQGSVDFDRVKASGRSFVYVKLTEGVDYIDSAYAPHDASDAAKITAHQHRAKAIRAAGLQYGIYHYLRPRSDRSGAEEAQWHHEIARRVFDFRQDLLPMVDVEESELDAKDTLHYVKQYVDEHKRLFTRKPILYTGSFWRDQLGDPDEDFNTYLWLPAYVDDPAPYKPRAWNRIRIWQSSGTGTVPGVSGPCDLDQLMWGSLRNFGMRAKHLP